jgi:hypothetical protein
VKTNFNIAWVDDNFSDAQMQSSTAQLSRKLLRKNSFNLKTRDVYATAVNGDFDALLADLASKVDLSNSVDLVAVDFELGDIVDNVGKKLTGDVIAKRFRDALPTVDIVFYSGKKNADELRLMLAKANVDCVNCIGRGALVNDTFMIIENVIERSCKISTLRGLILNSVCEMDDMIVDILFSHYSSTTVAIRDSFINKVVNFAEPRASLAEKNILKRSGIKSILSHRRIMSGSLFIYLKDIKNNMGLPAAQVRMLDDYRVDILDLRTSAAHAKEGVCVQTGQSMLENDNTGAQYKKSDIGDICKKIVAHENNIKSILSGMP